MMMMMLLIKKEVCVLQFNRQMSIYLNLYLALEGLGNETKEIVLRLSNDNAFLLVYSPEPQCQVWILKLYQFGRFNVSLWRLD